MKKLNLLFLIVFLGGLFLPLIILAGDYNVDGTTVHYEGLVPCGKSEHSPGESLLVTMPCQFCHFFVMLDGIIDFVLVFVVPPVAVLMIVIGGMMFMFAQFGGAEMLPGGVKGGPAMLSRAKTLITSVIIGLVIIYASYMIIGTVLGMIGLSETNPLTEWITAGSFTIHCPISPPQ